MIKARLEKQPTQDPRDTWWLKLNGSVERESLHLSKAIDQQIIVQKAIAAQTQRFEIDLASLDSFDSRGLQLLLMLSKQLSERDITLVLRNPSYFLQRILRILQLDRILEIELAESGEGGEGGKESRKESN